MCRPPPLAKVPPQTDDDPRRNASAIRSPSSGHRLWHLASTLQWAFWDALAAFASMLAAFHLTPAHNNKIPLTDAHIRVLPAAAIYAATVFIGSYALGLGHYKNLRSRARIILLLLTLALLAMVGTSLLVSIVTYKQIGRYILVICLLLFFAIEASVRLVWRNKMSNVTHHIVICGDQLFSRQLRDMVSHADFLVEIEGILTPDQSSISDLESILSGHCVHEIVVHDATTVFNQYLLTAIDRRIAVSNMNVFSERHFTKIPSAFIDSEWFFQIDLKHHHPFYYSTKRLLDVSLSLLGGLLCAPVVLLAIVAIKMETRGPAFYSQTRVGLLQVPFVIWKLRTMRTDSEPTGPEWAKAKDSRVTRVGRVLRKARIDEVPQFWNILRGDMALVGPRPERPAFVEKLAQAIPFYRQRHLIKPGLTGWAQICFRYGSSEEDSLEKLSYDFYYLKNASLLLDFQILLQTIGSVMRGSR